jgi:pimeloyl-ACP methyl ester carboxylesterase
MIELAQAWLPVAGGHSLSMRYSGGGKAKPAILFVHGLFSDSRFFLSPQGKGPSFFFLNHGFRIFLVDLRGHGKSKWPSGKRRWDWTFDTYAQTDIAAAIRFVQGHHQGPVFLFCHSLSGYAALAGIALQPELQTGLAGVSVFSSAVNDYTDGGFTKQATIRLAALIALAHGRFPAKALRQGRSDEPKGLMIQFAHWARRETFESFDGSTDYWRALTKIIVPIFSAVGERDWFHASPERASKLVARLGSTDKTFLVCGRSHGFSTDFGHSDLVRGSAAQQEILPRVCDWMRAHLHQEGE